MHPTLTQQPDLFTTRPAHSEEDLAAFRAYLTSVGWATRAQIYQDLGFNSRLVRDLAESLGADIVRGQAGFKLTAQLDPRSNDLPLALAAADAAISQGKKMVHYGLRLKRRLRALIT